MCTTELLRWRFWQQERPIGLFDATRNRPPSTPRADSVRGSSDRLTGVKPYTAYWYVAVAEHVRVVEVIIGDGVRLVPGEVQFVRHAQQGSRDTSPRHRSRETTARPIRPRRVIWQTSADGSRASSTRVPEQQVRSVPAGRASCARSASSQPVGRRLDRPCLSAPPTSDTSSKQPSFCGFDGDRCLNGRCKGSALLLWRYLRARGSVTFDLPHLPCNAPGP